MTHICYIYIYSYRLLKNVGITFDHNFVFQMEDGCLRIEKSDALPKDFFGNGVYSVSAIVGNNGAGKTSALRFLMEAVVEGYRIQDMAGVIVYENSGKIFVYQTESQKNSRLRIESTMPYTEIRNLMSIPVMYYDYPQKPYKNLVMSWTIRNFAGKYRKHETIGIHTTV